MKALAGVVKEIVGLFVDDEGLAIAILAVVVVALALAFDLHAPSIVTGLVIVFGCLAALAISVQRGRRR
jgi:putative effector of murein hydrolase LrgA (UPF0299 family)